MEHCQSHVSIFPSIDSVLACFYPISDNLCTFLSFGCLIRLDFSLLYWLIISHVDRWWHVWCHQGIIINQWRLYSSALPWRPSYLGMPLRFTSADRECLKDSRNLENVWLYIIDNSAVSHPHEVCIPTAALLYSVQIAPCILIHWAETKSGKLPADETGESNDMKAWSNYVSPKWDSFMLTLETKVSFSSVNYAKAILMAITGLSQ